MPQSWEQHIAGEEAANEAACRGTALANGFTQLQAEECEGSRLRCVDCPFYSPFESGNPKNSWVVFTRRTNVPKLYWLMLRLRLRGIPHRQHGLSFHAPVLWVRKGDETRAWNILGPVDNLPDDHPKFYREE